MIDLHCHLLPGIDDGPSTMEEALALARAQVAAGVELVTVTPHVDWDWPNRAQSIAAGLVELGAALEEAGIPLQVAMGAEVAMTVVPDLSDDEIAALGLGGGPRILLECPLAPGAVGFDRVVAYLRSRGHLVLLAHPERSPAFQRDPELLAGMVADGALSQITAGALVGRFGGVVQETAMDMVRRGLVHTVASDAHDALRRPPGLLEPSREVGLEAMAPWWCEAAPRALLEDRPLPPAPPLPDVAAPAPRRRGLFRRRG